MNKKDYLNFLQAQMQEKDQRRQKTRSEQNSITNQYLFNSSQNNIIKEQVSLQPTQSNIFWIPVIVPTGVNPSFLSLIGNNVVNTSLNNPITQQQVEVSNIGKDEKPKNNIENGFVFNENKASKKEKNNYLQELQKQINEKRKQSQERKRKEFEMDKIHENNFYASVGKLKTKRNKSDSKDKDKEKINENININASNNQGISAINLNASVNYENQIKNIKNELDYDNIKLNDSLVKLKKSVENLNISNKEAEDSLTKIKNDITTINATNKYYNERLLESLINRKVLINDFISHYKSNNNIFNNDTKSIPIKTLGVTFNIENEIKEQNQNEKLTILHKIRNGQLSSESKFLFNNNKENKLNKEYNYDIDKLNKKDYFNMVTNRLKNDENIILKNLFSSLEEIKRINQADNKSFIK